MLTILRTHRLTVCELAYRIVQEMSARQMKVAGKYSMSFNNGTLAAILGLNLQTLVNGTLIGQLFIQGDHTSQSV